MERGVKIDVDDGRTKKSIVNIAGNLTQQIVAIILNFVSRTVFIRTLGVEYLGIKGLFSDILGLLSMVDLGLNTAMIYSFYKPLAEKDERKISALTTFYKKIYNIIALLAGAAGIALTPFVRYIVNTERDIPNLEIYFLFSVAGIVASYLWVYKTSILTADQKNYYISRIQIVTTFIKTILQICVLCLFESYAAYLALGVAFNCITNIIASKKSERLYPYIRKKEVLNKREKRAIFSTLKSVFIFKISSVLINATDNTLISVIVGTVAVGYYSNYLMINTKLIALFSLFFTSITASIGNLIMREDSKKKYEIFACEQAISFMFCGVIVPCYIGLINDLIIVWLGREFCLSNIVVFMVALNLYMSCAMQPLWSYREATGLYTKTKWVMAVCAALNIVLSIALGIHLGVAGILLASVISRVVTYVWYEPKLLFGIYFERSSAVYFRGLILNFILVVILGMVSMKISQMLPVYSWGLLIVKGAAYALVSAFIILFFYYPTQGFQGLLERCKLR